MHGSAVMTAGWFQRRQLPFNDPVSYRCVSVAPHNPTAPPQPESEGPYSGKVVDFTDDGMVGVCADGWWGDAPLMRPPGVCYSSNGGQGTRAIPSFLTRQHRRSSRFRHPKLTSSANRRGGMECGSRSLYCSPSCSFPVAFRSWRRASVSCSPRWRCTTVLN